MSDFTLELYRGAGTDPSDIYTFAYTPAVSIDFNPLYNKSTIPPTLSGLEEVWEIEDAVLLNSVPVTLAAAFDTFTAFVGSRAAPVVGMRLKHGSTTIHTINTTTHTKFMVGRIRMGRTLGRHANHISFGFTVTGVKGFEAEEGGTGASVSKLEMRLKFAYNREGFLTKTLSGTVRTNAAGAEAAARAIGALDLPSDYFRYETNGPEGVDVEVLSYPADDAASFECRMVEQALAFPSSAIYFFTKNEQVTNTRFGTMVQVVVSAQGSSESVASAACYAEKPAQAETETKTTGFENNRVTYTWTYRTARASAILSKEYEYVATGGGRRLVPIGLAYAEPAILYGTKQPFTVVETYKVRVLGAPVLTISPPPRFPNSNRDEPADKFRVTRTKVGLDAEQDEFEQVWERTYIFSKAPPTFSDLVNTAFQQVRA